MHELEIVEGLAGTTKKAGMKIDIECFNYFFLHIRGRKF